MAIDLDALEALEKKATPGPWTLHRNSSTSVVGDGFVVAACGGYHSTLRDIQELTDELESNAAITAAARNALPELIRLARIGQRVEREVVQLGLCEIRNLVLKADTLYRFKKMHQCVSCQNYEDGK